MAHPAEGGTASILTTDQTATWLTQIATILEAGLPSLNTLGYHTCLTTRLPTFYTQLSQLCLGSVRGQDNEASAPNPHARCRELRLNSVLECQLPTGNKLTRLPDQGPDRHKIQSGNIPPMVQSAWRTVGTQTQHKFQPGYLAVFLPFSRRRPTCSDFFLPFRGSSSPNKGAEPWLKTVAASVPLMTDCKLFYAWHFPTISLKA